MKKSILRALIFLVAISCSAAAHASPSVAASFGYRSEESMLSSGGRETVYPFGIQAGWSFGEGRMEAVAEFQSFAPRPTKSGAVAVWTDRRELIFWGRYSPTIMEGNIEPYVAAGFGGLMNETETRFDVADGTQIDTDYSAPRAVFGFGLGAWIGKEAGWGIGGEGRVLRSEVLRPVLDYEMSLRIGYRY